MAEERKGEFTVEFIEPEATAEEDKGFDIDDSSEGSFRVPPVEDKIGKPTEKEASEEAFYATAIADPEDALGEHAQATREIMEKGESTLVRKEQEVTRLENEVRGREAVANVLQDPNITPETKEAVVINFLGDDSVQDSLKEKYILDSATTPQENTVEADIRQDDLVSKLQVRREIHDEERAQRHIDDNITKLSSFLTGIERLYKSSGNTLGFIDDATFKEAEKRFIDSAQKNPISAGLGNVAGLLGAALVAAPLGGIAAVSVGAFIGGVVQGTSKYAEQGLTPVDQETRLLSAIASGAMTSADFALPIFRAMTIIRAMALNAATNVVIGELDVTLQNEILEAFPELKLEQFDLNNITINSVMGAAIGAIFGRKANPNLTPIDPNSALKTTEMANPEKASDFATAAVIHNDERLANALGTTKGEIIGDLILEKPLLDIDAVTKNGMSINADVDRVSKNLTEQFEDLRYDPNSLIATQRIEDMNIILDIIADEALPTYKPARSNNNYESRFNLTDFKSKGKMVFGPKKGTGYDGLADARVARDKLQGAVDQLPKDQQSHVEIVVNPNEQFHLEWNWEKTYDDASINVFGKDSIKTDLLGIDASFISRSDMFGLGRWLFPLGRNNIVEQGALRGVERSARAETALIRAIEDNIANTKHGVEFNDMIREAESLGKNQFALLDIQKKFPHLTHDQSLDLLQTWAMWRRSQNFFHALTNRKKMNDLVKNDMEGVFDKDGNSLGYASQKVNAGDIAAILKAEGDIWDYSTNTSVKLDFAAIAKNKQTIVRMANRVDLPNNRYHEYAVIGGETKLDILPREVVPRVEGYSPRRVKENWFVDRHPSKATIDGRVISNPRTLKDNFSNSEAGVRTEREGNRIATELQAKYPDDVISVRRARENSFDDVISDHEIMQRMHKESRRRGDERLPGREDGEARLEDRLVTAMDTVKTLVRMDAFRAWEDTFQAAFIKGYGKFLNKGEFPTNKSEIEVLPNMTKTESIEFKNAIALFDYFQNQKNFTTRGDVVWDKMLTFVADLLEKARLDTVSDLARGLGDKGNLIAKWPKAASSTLFIHLSPLRQWIIQPQQMMEMYALDPANAPQMFADMLAVRSAIAAEAVGNRMVENFMKKTSRGLSPMGGKEFDQVIDAIKKAGTREGIDKNVLVDGVFEDVAKHFVDSNSRQLGQIIKKGAILPRVAEVAIKASRKGGFDAAELTNRIGLWLQTKAIWQKQNPGKNWNTLENRELIAAEAFRLSGAMNRGGNLPYQQGMLSVLMQFAAVNHKLTVNLLSANQTILSGSQRARLAATRFALYGGKWGTPGGVAIYAWISQSDNEDIKGLADQLEIGIIDRIVNWLANTLMFPDEKSQISLAKGITPYSENFLPMFDFIGHLINITDDDPVNDPRFPALVVSSNIGKTVDQVRGWFATEDITTIERYKEALFEVAELASGMNNISQALLMWETRAKITANGNKLGWEQTRAEALARAFGATNEKELLTYEIIELSIDGNKKIKAVVDTVHKMAMNARTKIGTKEFEIETRRIKSFLELIAGDQFSKAEMREAMRQLVEKDKMSYRTKSSAIIADLFKARNDQQSVKNRQMIDRLRKIDDPRAEEMIRLLDGVETQPEDKR